jgi:hypothetical protein
LGKCKQSHSRVFFRKRSSYNSSIIKEIVGPDAENLTIGLPGNKDKDVLLADLVGKILTNGKEV